MTPLPRPRAAAAFLLVAAGTGALEALPLAPVAAGSPAWSPVGAVTFLAVLHRRPAFLLAALVGVAAVVPFVDSSRLVAAVGSLVVSAGLAALWRRRERSATPELDLAVFVVLSTVIAATAQTLVIAAALAVCLIQVVAQRLEQQRDRAAKAEATHRTILDSLAEALIVLDGAGRVLRINPAACHLFSIDADATLGRADSLERFAFTDRNGRPVASRDLPDRRALQGRPVDDLLLCMERPDGTLRWVNTSARLLPGSQAPEDPAVVITVTDVTERHEAEVASRAETTQLRHRALHDGLTGLPNRTMLMDRLAEAHQTAVRRGAGTGLIVVDLDGFKGVNDRLGHAVGDEVLVQVALRLRSTLRSSDTAARLGGDEFVVLCEDLHPGMADLEVTHIAQRLQELLNQVYVTTGGPAEIGASVGWAIAAPGEALDLDLVVKADEAMLADKRERKGVPEEQRPEVLDRSVVVPSDAESLTVYIVDDDPAMRLLAGRILESSGTDLIVIGEAAEGETAIAEIGELGPDLVLCDVMMPEVSGPDVVVAVRRQLPDQRFIFWSATSAPELERYEAELQVPFVLKDRIEELPAALLAASGRGPAGAQPIAHRHEATVPSR